MNRSTGRGRSAESAFIDDLLVEMSDHRRRCVLYYLRRNRGSADVDELVRHLSGRTGLDRERATIVVEQVVLPRLDDFGIVDYDRSRGQVLYQGGSFATEFIDCVVERELFGR